MKVFILLVNYSMHFIFRNHESEVEDAFRCFDRKGEGVVTRQELGFIFQVSILYFRFLQIF